MVSQRYKVSVLVTVRCKVSVLVTLRSVSVLVTVRCKVSVWVSQLNDKLFSWRQKQTKQLETKCYESQTQARRTWTCRHKVNMSSVCETDILVYMYRHTWVFRDFQVFISVQVFVIFLLFACLLITGPIFCSHFNLLAHHNRIIFGLVLTTKRMLSVWHIVQVFLLSLWITSPIWVPLFSSCTCHNQESMFFCHNVIHRMIMNKSEVLFLCMVHVWYIVQLFSSQLLFVFLHNHCSVYVPIHSCAVIIRSTFSQLLVHHTQ